MHTQPTLFDLTRHPARRKDALVSELTAFVCQDKPTEVSWWWLLFGIRRGTWVIILG